MRASKEMGQEAQQEFEKINSYLENFLCTEHRPDIEQAQVKVGQFIRLAINRIPSKAAIERDRIKKKLKRQVMTTQDTNQETDIGS